MQPRCQAEKEGKHTQPARGSSGDRWERERERKGEGKTEPSGPEWIQRFWRSGVGARERGRGGLNGGAGGMDVIYRA